MIAKIFVTSFKLKWICLEMAMPLLFHDHLRYRVLNHLDCGFTISSRLSCDYNCWKVSCLLKLSLDPLQDAFREAKANGFSVTVIRKGELQLNVDQTLEEVEEQIAEIGSKIYHEMMMKERSVDISSLMKGVFGFNSKSMKR